MVFWEPNQSIDFQLGSEIAMDQTLDEDPTFDGLNDINGVNCGFPWAFPLSGWMEIRLGVMDLFRLDPYTEVPATWCQGIITANILKGRNLKVCARGCDHPKASGIWGSPALWSTPAPSTSVSALVLSGQIWLQKRWAEGYTWWCRRGSSAEPGVQSFPCQFLRSLMLWRSGMPQKHMVEHMIIFASNIKFLSCCGNMFQTHHFLYLGAV